MKKRTIKFEIELEVVCPGSLDDDWVANQYLSSGRFSVDSFSGEPGVVVAAFSGVKEIRSYGNQS